MLLSRYLSGFRSYQTNLVRTLLTTPERYISVLARRRSGKSTAILGYIAIRLQFYSGNIMLYEPSGYQARQMFNQAKRMLANKQGFTFRSSAPYEISYGSNTCIFASYGSDPKVGPGYKILIYDEAFGVDREFFEYMSPTTATFSDAKTVLISTPRLKSGVFYNYFTSTLPGTLSINWHLLNQDNPEYINSIDPLELELQRKMMTPALFNSEYNCQWQDAISDVFGDVNSYIKPSNEVPTILGVDPGSGNEGDYTATAAMSNTGHVTEVKFCNTLGPVAQVEFILSVIDRIHPRVVAIETNSIGEYVYDMLSKKQLRIQLIKTPWSHSSKNNDIENLRADLAFNTVTLPDNPKLIEQFVAMKCEFKPDGSYTYNSPSPPGDDGVAAIAHANFVRRSNFGTYNIR